MILSIHISVRFVPKNGIQLYRWSVTNTKMWTL